MDYISNVQTFRLSSLVVITLIVLLSTINVRKFTDVAGFLKCEALDVPLYSRNPPSRYPYKCRNGEFGCTSVFWHADSHQTHELICTLTSKEAYQEHLESHPHQCTNCLKRFVSRDLWKNHLASVFGFRRSARKKGAPQTRYSRARIF